MWGVSAPVSNYGFCQGMYLLLRHAEQPQLLSFAAWAGVPSRPMLMPTVASTMATLLAILIVSAFDVRGWVRGAHPRSLV